jgi:hypothetical protein
MVGVCAKLLTGKLSTAEISHRASTRTSAGARPGRLAPQPESANQHLILLGIPPYVPCARANFGLAPAPMTLQRVHRIRPGKLEQRTSWPIVLLARKHR